MKGEKVWIKTLASLMHGLKCKNLVEPAFVVWAEPEKAQKKGGPSRHGKQQKGRGQAVSPAWLWLWVLVHMAWARKLGHA